MLANGDNPAIVQQIIGKIFENVNKADFGEDVRNKVIIGMISREGEGVLFKGQPIRIGQESVDKWMVSFEKEMQQTVFKIIKQGNKQRVGSKKFDDKNKMR